MKHFEHSPLNSSNYQLKGGTCKTLKEIMEDLKELPFAELKITFPLGEIVFKPIKPKPKVSAKTSNKGKHLWRFFK